MESYYDIQIKSTLRELIDSGRLEIAPPDEYFEIIDRFYPTEHNRINWLEVPNHISKVIAFDEQLEQFLDDLLEENPSLSFDNVIVLGDDLFNFAYKLSFSNFRTVANIFFGIPQHTYVIFEKTYKCLNCTFEREIFFGEPKH